MITTVRADRSGGFYVYWESGTAYGAQGSGMGYDSALRLAEELREGGRAPMTLGIPARSC